MRRACVVEIDIFCRRLTHGHNRVGRCLQVRWPALCLQPGIQATALLGSSSSTVWQRPASFQSSASGTTVISSKPREAYDALQPDKCLMVPRTQHLTPSPCCPLLPLLPLLPLQDHVDDDDMSEECRVQVKNDEVWPTPVTCRCCWSCQCVALLSANRHVHHTVGLCIASFACLSLCCCIGTLNHRLAATTAKLPWSCVMLQLVSSRDFRLNFRLQHACMQDVKRICSSGCGWQYACAMRTGNGYRHPAAAPECRRCALGGIS